MKTYEQPPAACDIQQRVVFSSVQNLDYEADDNNVERMMRLFDKLFSYVESRQPAVPEEYARLVYLVADEAWCGVDPVYADFSVLPRVTDTEYDQFVEIAIAKSERCMAAALEHTEEEIIDDLARCALVLVSENGKPQSRYSASRLVHSILE